MTQQNPLSVSARAAREQATVERVIEILRRDLKLGSEVAIGAETPLLGGAYDLDSLDVLLMLTSVEKEFGIKIPNQAVRQDAFTSVAALARYIDEQERRG